MKQLKVETNSVCFYFLQNSGADAAQKSAYTGVSAREDMLTVSSAYQQYTSSPAKNTATQARIDALTEQLRKDTSFSEYRHRTFSSHPIGRELAKEIILADENLQEQIAKNMWMSRSKNADKSSLPQSWRDINVKAMLLSSDLPTVKTALSGYESVLREKARFCGLSDTEKLLSANLEETSFNASSTFDQKMDRLFDKVRQEFEDQGMVFDESKSYSFHLDTSTFQFSVSGGTETENALIEKVLNKSDYTGNNVLTALNAIYNHRHEDGSYNPWNADKLSCKEGISTFGVASVSADYAQKMRQLFGAYGRCQTDKHLKTQYGFGVDDLEYRGGAIVGKTPEARAAIARGDFMKNTGYSYLDMLNAYKGTPEFSDPVFTYENGKFQTTYQVFEDENCEGATNSSAIIAQARYELSQKEALLEGGRAAVLAKYPSGSSRKSDLLRQRFSPKRSSAVGDGAVIVNGSNRREQAIQVILSSDALQKRIEDMMWNRLARVMAKNGGLAQHTGRSRFDVKAILRGETSPQLMRF